MCGTTGVGPRDKIEIQDLVKDKTILGVIETHRQALANSGVSDVTISSNSPDYTLIKPNGGNTMETNDELAAIAKELGAAGYSTKQKTHMRCLDAPSFLVVSKPKANSYLGH